MKNLDEPFYVDSEGLKKLHEEVASLNLKLEELNGKKKEAVIADPKDGRIFEELNDLVLESQRVQEQIRGIYSKIASAVLVENHNEDELVDLGDIVTADMIYSKEDLEEIKFTLVGGFGNIRADIPEISLNSPLGQSTYKKSVGDMCVYSVNGDSSYVLIKNILKQKDILEDSSNRGR